MSMGSYYRLDPHDTTAVPGFSPIPTHFGGIFGPFRLPWGSIPMALAGPLATRPGLSIPTPESRPLSLAARCCHWPRSRTRRRTP